MTITDLPPARALEVGLVPDRLAAALERIPVCRAVRHGATEYVHEEYGCRCPGALAAHKAHNIRRRGRTRMRPAAIDEHGNCAAGNHGPSEYAYRQGCRCTGSTEAYDRVQQGRRASATAAYAARAGRRRIEREHAKWRGPDTRVNRMNLILLLSGFVDNPTKGEQIAAVHKLMRTGNRWGTGLNNNIEIAERLGVTTGRVSYLKRQIEAAQANRHLRRLADVQWKQMRETT